MQSTYLVISCSLSESSRSRVLSKAVFDCLSRARVDVDWVDARDLNLPFCDGAEAFNHPSVAPLARKILEARCVILGVPIYNYSMSGFAKNLLELTGDAWHHKIVGFLCAAGGHRSYMSIMSLANSLMLEFECVIIPRYVYGSKLDFENGQIKDDDLEARIESLATTAIRFSQAWGTGIAETTD